MSGSSSTPSKTGVNAELDLVMQLLTNLELCTETADRLIDFILTTAQSQIDSGPTPASPTPSPTSSAPSSPLTLSSDLDDDDVQLVHTTPAPVVSSSQTTTLSVSSTAVATPQITQTTPAPAVPSSQTATPSVSPTAAVTPQTMQAPPAPAVSSSQTATPSVSLTAAATPQTTQAPAPVMPPAQTATLSVSLTAAATPQTTQAPPAPVVPPARTSYEGITFPISNGPVASFLAGEAGGNGRWMNMYNYFVYELPAPTATGPFYLVTVGRRVGVFSTWQRTSPHVTGVSCASFSRVESVDQGLDLLDEAIDLGEARWVP
ncbi:hypothetical protein HYDPIDRAFT_34614 [Hydnomerulius pinastri MD-312]|uniref:Ribonuclease H1 N-terminal domain-containing protein n=1 Tax=Hydnomerulius pinastri MD-312 TaxID=994086 RepID=A0A0C9W5Q7_9AGAM|nr:hypothetical protein HYDPIDRAFT_34614 [Hydnomerulius pinastri MD-312]